MASWEDFGLHPHLIETITKVYGYSEPTDVQIELLKYQNTRLDLLTAAKTGSGKTFCYILPILSKIFYELDNNGAEEDEHQENVDKEENEDEDEEPEDEEDEENDEEDEEDEDEEEEGQQTSGGKKRNNTRQVDSLVFLPTRDLAIQVYKEFKNFCTGDYKKVGLSLVIGGLSKDKQIRILNKGPRVIISTPGRLWDFIQNENILNLRLIAGIRFLVLDEVDRIIELGQFEELKKILNFVYKEALNEQEILQQNFAIEKDRQKEFVEFEGQKLEVITDTDLGQDKMLTPEQVAEAKRRAAHRRTFIISATLTKISGTSRMMTNKKFKAMIKKMKKKNKDSQETNQLHPKIMDIMNKLDTKNKLKIVDLTQDLGSFLPTGLTIERIRCSTEDKIYFTYYFLKQQNMGLSIVFVNSINAARKLKNILTQLHMPSVTLHSHMRQAMRIKKLQDFEKGKKRLLITTDVGARGLDINNVNLVIHYHMPRDFDTFVHRCGRTARANRAGRAVIISDGEDQKRFIKYIREFPKDTIQNLELGYNEVFGDKPLVQQAMEVERKTHVFTKEEKEKKWMVKASQDIGIDEIQLDEFTNKGRQKPKKRGIDDDEEDHFAAKQAKRDVMLLKKRYEEQYAKEKIKTQKKFSSFLNPFEIQEIAQKLKRVK